MEVQKLLGRLMVSHGSLDAAQKAFRTALEFSPDDEECRDELTALLQAHTRSLDRWFTHLSTLLVVLIGTVSASVVHHW